MLFSSNVYAQKKVDNILEFGAKSDLEPLQTKHIQATIDAANENEGGKVVIPEGIFVSGSIILKSNIELHLEEGALLLGSLDPRDYTKLRNSLAFIFAYRQ